MPGLRQKKTHEPIPNEANIGIPNERGTLAMARTGAPHSTTAQFFINVVDRIRGVKTGNVGPLGDVPVKDVVIISVTRK